MPQKRKSAAHKLPPLDEQKTLRDQMMTKNLAFDGEAPSPEKAAAGPDSYRIVDDPEVRPSPKPSCPR